MSRLPETVARWVRLQRELGIDDVVLDVGLQEISMALPLRLNKSTSNAVPTASEKTAKTEFGPTSPRRAQRPSAPVPSRETPGQPRAHAAPIFTPPPGRPLAAPARPAGSPSTAAPLRPAATRASFPTFGTLAELEEHANSCQRCVLSGRRRSVVPSGGPEKADWAILTLYAWAEDCDKRQILAGNYAAPLLDLATSVGLGAPAVAAIFACTPDDPADATIQGFTEAVRCRGHWLQRLKLSGCKAILVLDHKATTLARGPSSPVEWPAFRGQRWEIGEIPAISTHHPSRMARQTALQPEVEADLKAIVSLVRGGG